MTPDVFNSPAVALLVELEAAGLQVVERDGVVYVRPAGQLTDAQRELLREERAAILTLLRICDDGVTDRRVAFEKVLSEATGATLPALLFRAGVPYTRHTCYSCGDSISQSWGRCWRCSLAARLACRQGIHADWIASYDAARAVA
jgi:hypothetical protein